MQFACTLIVFCTWYSAKGRTECLGALWRCKVIKAGCHLLVPGNTGSGPTVLVCNYNHFLHVLKHRGLGQIKEKQNKINVCTVISIKNILINKKTTVYIWV